MNFSLRITNSALRIIKSAFYLYRRADSGFVVEHIDGKPYCHYDVHSIKSDLQKLLGSLSRAHDVYDDEIYKCSENNEGTRYFCKSCGAFLDAKNFDSSAYELPQLKIMRIVDNLCHMPAGEEVPDAMFSPHVEKVEKLQALFNLPEFEGNKNLGLMMQSFLNLCRNPEFQIAFVGTIKTGKSTLINALLGKNYASMEVTPETAALTKFRFSPRDYLAVTFYTAEECG